MAYATSTFTATGQSSTVYGRGVVLKLDGTFVGTALLQFLDTDGTTWVTSRTYTAAATSMPVYIEVPQRMAWRLNCSAYTSGTIAYTLWGVS